MDMQLISDIEQHELDKMIANLKIQSEKNLEV